MRRPTSVLLATGVALSLFVAINACIFKYGTSPDSLVESHSGTHWDHGMHGDDWTGVDGSGKPWVCMTGTRQSPINVPARETLDTPKSRVPQNLRTIWSYPDIVSNGSNVEVINNGHTIQVEWLSPYAGRAKIAVPAEATAETRITSVLNMSPGDPSRYVGATPIQFHFHSTSEHPIAGKYYPLEMHIVHKVTDLPACKGGCYTVTGVLFELVDGPDNPLLNAMWAVMPMREGKINYLPAGAAISMADLINPYTDREYVTYEGSLTTPPCSEGLLWHVMTRAQKISHKQWRKYKMAVGMKECSQKNVTDHPHRRLLANPEGSADEYTCKVVAYGTNFRTIQPPFNRIVKLAPK